jgi:bifunctional non-homologous end joining protein LigD
MPTYSNKRRLALRVEDHALSHLDYEGPTPIGNEGAVRVRMWDRGTCETEKVSEDEIVVLLRGKRLDGRYAIFRTREGSWPFLARPCARDPDVRVARSALALRDC